MACRSSISTAMPISGPIENFMPYYRDDDQYQMVANLSWLKGQHNVRLGGDLYFTTLNHIQPEIADNNFGARGGWNSTPARRSSGAVPAAPTSTASRPSFSGCRRGRTAETERRALHDTELAVQLLRARSVAGRSEVTLSFGTRYSTSRSRRGRIAVSSGTTSRPT